MPGIPHREVLEEYLQDPAARAEWERLDPARALANLVIGYRADHELTQTAFGRLVGLSQAQVARLEIAEHNPSIDTLGRIASGLGARITVTIEPRAEPESGSPRVLMHLDARR